MKLLWSAVALVSLLLVVAACGEEPLPTRTVTVALDHTTARTSPKIAQDYAAAARRAADPVLNQGGHLRVVLFAGSGVAPAVLIDEDVQSTQGLTGNGRKRFVIAARANLATLLAQALGLEAVAAGSPLERQLKEMAADGSDIAGDVSQEVELLKRRGGGTLLVASDGLQRSAGIDFSKTIMATETGAAAGALGDLMPADASGVDLTIVGVGVTGGKVTTERAKKLVEVWDAACDKTQAESCLIGTAV